MRIFSHDLDLASTSTRPTRSLRSTLFSSPSLSIHLQRLHLPGHDRCRRGCGRGGELCASTGNRNFKGSS